LPPHFLALSFRPDNGKGGHELAYRREKEMLGVIFQWQDS
jgi:hypothetical protein